MEINVTRREILRFVGGSALGLLLTPLPWKALDDSAIWTQNWPWIPEPGRGDISYKFTTCSLCPASCGVRARCIGSQPVSLSGVAAHPLSRGTLCPTGILAHHLRYHPSRLLRPVRIASGKDSSRQTQMSYDEVFNEISLVIKAVQNSSLFIAVVDGMPNRVASTLFQKFAADVKNAKYIFASDASLNLLASLFEKPIGSLGYDIDNADLILSFGAPLFDGWGTPARTALYLEKKENGKQKVIQVETFCSRTANVSDQWIPILPGTEAVFALGIANVILDEKLNQTGIKEIGEIKKLTAQFSPSMVSGFCGVEQDAVIKTARNFALSKTSIAVADANLSYEAQSAVMMLNLLVGNIGRKVGIAVHNKVPTGLSIPKNTNAIISDIYSFPDNSIGVMLIDESLSGCKLPNTIIRKKLAKNGIVISLSPFITERPFCTQYVIPTPVFLESFAELSAPIDSEVSAISISAQLVPAPDGVVDPIQFVQRLTSAIEISSIETGTTEELLKRRIAEIHKAKRGVVFNSATGQTTDVKSLSSPDNLWSALITGGCWIDTSQKVKSLPEINFAKFASSVKNINQTKLDKNQLLLVPFVEKSFYDGKDASLLMSKVSQESGLRVYGCRAYLNPKTAEEFGIMNESKVSLKTEKGSLQAQMHYDASIMPGIVAATDAINPNNIISLCELNDNVFIKPTAVKILKV